MKRQQHYGTVSYWFDERRLGAICPNEPSEHHILLVAQHLADDYGGPQIGDAVRYRTQQDEQQRMLATDVELLSRPVAGSRVKIELSHWNLQLNGGYGFLRRNRALPVFILGQFLHDQSRVPEEGELLEGRLLQHDNGRWLLSDVLRCETEIPEAAPVAAVPPPDAAEALPPELAANVWHNGQIAYWDNSRDYGFIQCGSRRIHFQLAACSNSVQRGDEVRFLCRSSSDGRQNAVSVVLLNETAAPMQETVPFVQTASRSGIPMYHTKITAYSAAALLYLALVALRLPALAAIYAVFSLVAMLLYRHDKQIARRAAGRRNGYQGRISESTLLGIGLAGGWPGALAARFIWRHKTTKPVFVAQFWLTVLLNVLITAWLLHRGILNEIGQRLQ